MHHIQTERWLLCSVFDLYYGRQRICSSVFWAGRSWSEVVAFVAFVNARAAAVDADDVHRLCDPHSVTCCHHASATSQETGFTYCLTAGFASCVQATYGQERKIPLWEKQTVPQTYHHKNNYMILPRVIMCTCANYTVPPGSWKVPITTNNTNLYLWIPHNIAISSNYSNFSCKFYQS